MMEATFSVELVLKGDIPEGKQLAFRFPQLPDALGFVNLEIEGFEPGQRCLIFLARQKEHYEPVDALTDETPTLTLPADFALPAVPDGTPLERTETLLVAMIEKADLPLQHAILREIGWYRAGNAPPAYDTAGRQNPGVFARADTCDRLGALLVSPDRNLRYQAASLLAEYQYLPALPVLVNELMDFRAAAIPEKGQWNPPGGRALYPATATAEQQRRWSPPGFFNITSGLESNWQLEALPYQCALLRSPDSDIRQAAAYALRDAASPTTVPVLVAALDDGEEEVRYLAATGLAAITKQNQRFLTGAYFTQREAEEIKYWKDWWAVRKDQPDRWGQP
jgi:hypothetical protein